MWLPEAVKSVAACAPGKSVRVVSAGKSYELPTIQEPEPEPPTPIPNPLEVVCKQLLDRDAETRSLIAARSDETLKAVKEAVDAVTSGQQLVVDTLMLPVIPKYNKEGLVVEGRRQSRTIRLEGIEAGELYSERELLERLEETLSG